jgi:glycerol-3-phosphate dehydrogenase
MRRRVAPLGGRTFDLLVIGGGIYGAWIAYDAALRGLAVALIERGDWGSGTSSASSKLIHGGLRYLEHGHLGLVAKALRERSRLMALAPHRVWPLRFLLPVFADSRMGRLQLTAGLRIYDLLAGPRPGVEPHRRLGAAGLQAQAAFLGAGLRGGFAYGDAGSDDARFTLEIIAGAIAAGAVAVNHVTADHLLRSRSGDVVGALAVDNEGGRAYEVGARLTVNAAGPWAAGLLGRHPSAERAVRHTKGVHLVMPPLPLGVDTPRTALLLTAASDRRVFFLIPWYGATLLGTTDTDFRGEPGSERVEDADVAYLLGEARRRCPGLGWTAADVRGSFVGLRTLRVQTGRSAGATNRDWSLDEPLPRLLMPTGGKFTSARVEAARTVDRALALLGRPPAPCATVRRRFPWCPEAPWAEWSAAQQAAGARLGLDPDVAAACARRYGGTLGLLHARLRREPELAARIVPGLPFCLAEIAHAVEHEMAIDLDDVLRRRVPVRILAKPARDDEARLCELADAARLASREADPA